MMTEKEIDKNFVKQIEEFIQKEQERLKLNKYCADNSIPDDCKAEMIIDYQTKYWRL